jgi:DNA-binding NarL/FixJ family response regulator
MFRGALRMLIDHEADMEVVGEAENSRQAVEVTRELQPPGMKILAHTMHSASFMSGMMEAGAVGFVLKGCDFEELAGAVRKAAGSPSSRDGP